MALHTHVFSPLFLLILAVIIHPSYGSNHLNNESPVEAVCRHTSSHEYCAGNMIPRAPLTAEGIASTAGMVHPHRHQLRPQKCWDLNMKAMADLWSASGSFYSKNIKAMVNYLYGAARVTKRCQVLISGHHLTGLAAKNS
ncbi:hypothetical protein F3Y22_tig00117056pilonHSYRG01303 [Hibiscus syriacus]|uniref:Pectinesterase inhibitor domain-containing protein n=1 Tax=Hibiscus syriacus TaxID=106335 RepID=A0A6A2W905_HIBSY|nr:hypothetical protein F3Y22_tig00117056pilonHSYRG01303 [Hibiscus syriacus]